MNTTACGWQSRPLSELATTASGGTPNRNRKDYFGGIIPWVKSGELNDNCIHKTEENITETGLRNSSAKIFPAGTVLIAMYGATVGKTAVLKANASTNQAICGISPGPDLDAEYLRYHLMFLRNDLLSQRYGGAQPNISQQIIRNQTVAYPPLSEQKSIAHTLLTVQRAIAAQERIIQTTTELKKALMQKLFTEGLRGEPQKETEIGLVPESWEVVQLGELLDTAQYGISVKGNPSGNCAILRMTNQVDGKIVGEKLQFTEISEGEIQRFRVHRGDILFNRTNSLDLVGRTAIFDVEGEYVFASYLIRLRTKERKLNPFFLNCYFNTDETQARLKSIATRAVSQSNISATRLKGFLIPNPSIDEQKQIVSTGISIDQKLAAHRSKLEQLKNIFRTLLRELMTAKIHVHCLGFSNSTTAISR